MPIYFYWGEDSFRLERAIQKLRDQVLDPAWMAFNYDRLPPESTIEALNQAMTPPLGMGDRLVWLEETKITQQCPKDLEQELERTLSQLPETTHLLLTSSHKPDGRLKSTKLFKKIGIVEEFTLPPPWDTDGIRKQVKAQAQDQQLKLEPEAEELLATAVGSDSRKLMMELEKLSLFAGDPQVPISAEMVTQLVPASAYNSFQLAATLRQGDLNRSLDILTHLLDRNEPALRILAVLVGQFRTWLWVRIKIDQGERDNKAIAQAAEIGNPNRVFFLRKEVQSLSSRALHRSLAALLDLEFDLKRGRPERETFQITLIQIANGISQSD